MPVTRRPLAIGDVVTVGLPRHRPVVVVGTPHGEQRFATYVVAPLTTADGPWAVRNPFLYPRLQAGLAKLPRDSIVLLDQVRAVDASRFAAYLGTIPPETMRPIRSRLLILFV